MQRLDPSLWQHSWRLPLQPVTHSHFMTPFYIILLSSQPVLHKGQTSRHFPVPYLFSNILDEINLYMIGEVLGCTEEKKSTYIRARNPSD